MIKHIDISSVHKDFKLESDLIKYIEKKIGKLDKHLKKNDRSLARADVKLQENAGKGNNKCTVEVILHVPGIKLTASESTMNMYAAVDIVENKLQNQLKRHKEKSNPAQDKHKRGRARKAFGKIFSR